MTPAASWSCRVPRGGRERPKSDSSPEEALYEDKWPPHTATPTCRVAFLGNHAGSFGAKPSEGLGDKLILTSYSPFDGTERS
jgi:hypothetical protein